MLVERRCARRRAAARADVLARHLEADARGELLDGFGEAQLVVFHQEADRGAVRAAAEAVIELLVRAHPNDGVFSLWNGQQALNSRARFLERHAAADQLDDVGAGDQLVDEVLWDAAGHRNGAKDMAGSNAPA